MTPLDFHILLAAILLGWVAGWLVPTLLVAVHAERAGHSFSRFLIVALVLSWPVALALMWVLAELSSPQLPSLEASVAGPPRLGRGLKLGGLSHS